MATRVIKKCICDICNRNVFVDQNDYPEDWEHISMANNVGLMVEGNLIEDICPTCADEILSEISNIMHWHKKYTYTAYERRMNEQNITNGLSDR